MTTRLLVLGATAYSEVFIDMFEAVPDVVFEGCVENLDRSKCAGAVAGLPVHWTDEVDAFRDTHSLICSLATTKRAAWIEQMAARGFSFATLVHPSSVVSRRTVLKQGVSVDALSAIAGFSHIGGSVRIGRRASIGHHTRIGEYSTIHPGAIVSGNCLIGRKVTIGTGAVVIDGRTIGDGAVIAAGAVVNKDVAPGVLLAGNPGQVKREDYGPI